MTTQPEAIRLAEVFETYAVDHQPDGWPAIRQETLNSAAAELRRLHAENEALRAALEQPVVEQQVHHWIIPDFGERTFESEYAAKRFLERFGCEDEHPVACYTAPQPAQQEGTEHTQTEPDFEQRKQILSGLANCHSRDSQHEFLRVWIRDWTNHKISKAPQPDARTTAIQACIDRLIFGGQPAAAQILRHHFAKDLGEE